MLTPPPCCEGRPAPPCRLCGEPLWWTARPGRFEGRSRLLWQVVDARGSTVGVKEPNPALEGPHVAGGNAYSVALAAYNLRMDGLLHSHSPRPAEKAEAAGPPVCCGWPALAVPGAWVCRVTGDDLPGGLD